jgi:hypothetical protein
VVTEEVPDIVSLEILCAPWAERPPRKAAEIRLKRALLREIARIARLLHGNGLNHRDFYLCHFCLQSPPTRNGREQEPEPRLYLLDLHRAQIRRRTPRRWLVKDLGSLYFSAMEIGLTRRDRLRFIAHYRQRPLRMILASEGRFWQAVRRRAVALYRSFHRREPPAGC